MIEEEAIEKLLEFINSLRSEDVSVSLNDTLFKKIKDNNIKPIGKSEEGRNRFKATKGERGVFIFYEEYVGYYSYDFGFYRIFPRRVTTGYTLQEFKQMLENWPPDFVREDEGLKYYPWAEPEATYDITDLVMGNKQMSLMNWKRPPF